MIFIKNIPYLSKKLQLSKNQFYTFILFFKLLHMLLRISNCQFMPRNFTFHNNIGLQPKYLYFTIYLIHFELNVTL